MSRYLAGLAVATGGVLAGGWLILSPFALGYQPAGRDLTLPAVVNIASGIGVVVVSAVTILLWGVAWRARLRDDGVLPQKRRDRPSAASPGPSDSTEPSPKELQALLAPLVAALADDNRMTAGARVPSPAYDEATVPRGRTLDPHEEQW
ncbi:MAG: hypothetical protein ACRDN9_19520 [Streptosporangiaceae bacterium]